MDFSPELVNIPAFTGPGDGDSEDITTIMDAYAYVEKIALADKGLLYSYGWSDIPTQLEGPPWPVSLHFLAQQGAQNTNIGAGGSGNNPASKEREIINVVTMLVMAPIEATIDMIVLQAQAAPWLEWIKQVYFENTTMAGACHEVSYVGYRWGALEEFGGKDWWGYYIFTNVRAERLYKRG